MTVMAVAVLVLTGTVGWTDQAARREEQSAALRLRAQERMSRDLLAYSADEVRDIEAQYRSTTLLHGMAIAISPQRRREVLESLVAKYPRANLAGCALVDLARMSGGEDRERYLQAAIKDHADAWFENGAQVGPLAMALLAVHYAGLDRMKEAEQLASEITKRYPGSIDSAGAPLDDVLIGLRLMRSPRQP